MLLSLNYLLNHLWCASYQLFQCNAKLLLAIL